MPRVALLLSGLPRLWSHCVQSQLALFRDTPFDVFFHFWDTVDADEKAAMVDAYQPKAHVFQPQVDFTDMAKEIKLLDLINSPTRLLSQYFSWKAVAQLMDEYARSDGIRYDYAVRLRADLRFSCALDKVLPQLGPNDLLFSSMHDFGLINDTFVLGGVAAVMYYMSMFDHVVRYNQTVQANAELLMLEHMRRRPSSIQIIRTPLPVLVFRAHMVNMPMEQALREHPGLNKWEDPEVLRDHIDSNHRIGNAARAEAVETFINQQLEHLKKMRIGLRDPGGSPGESRPPA
jgi:hypothetical protein